MEGNTDRIDAEGDSKCGISLRDWGDYKWQLRHTIRTVDELQKWVNVTAEEREAIKVTSQQYKWQVTSYYASLMDPEDPTCPIRRQAIPSTQEMQPSPVAEIDPVGDMYYRKTARIVHKYPNRAIMLVSDTCPVYCRHCTRKYHTTDVTGTYWGEGYQQSLNEDIEYLRQHPEIDDILLTGGDPLSLADGQLERILQALRTVPSINIIRLGSRFPVLLPQRIDDALCEMLARYHPVWLNTHFNHRKEITPESAAAVDRLLRSGIPVQNQSVLLKGINDDPEVMRQLIKGLLSIRVRPYYLYHCDNVRGVSHFRTSLESGRRVMNSLAGFETGFSVPQYIITTKIGKIPLYTEALTEKDGRLMATNYRQQQLDVTEALEEDTY
jgi:lysine 2,3-aminomutase